MQQKTTHTAPHLTAMAYHIAKIAHTSENPMVVFSENAQDAQRLVHEISLFLPNQNQRTVQLLPDWEILPYDNLSVQEDIISQRLSALSKIHAPSHITVTAMTTAIHRLAPIDFIQQHSFSLNVGEQCQRQNFSQQLIHYGYQRVEDVLSHGEFALRGSILDLFPMGSEHPFRIDFFDDEIDSIRLFDVETQRSQSKVDTIQLLPAREYPTDEAGIEKFRTHWRMQFSGDLRSQSMYQDISPQTIPAGIEYYLPLFFDQTSTLFDYLAPQTELIQQGDIWGALDQYRHEVEHRYEQYGHDVTRPLLSPNNILVEQSTLKSQFQQWPVLKLKKEKTTLQPPSITSIDAFALACDQRLLFCADSQGRAEIVHDLLVKKGIQAARTASWKTFLEEPHPIGLCVANLESGFLLEDCLLITENDLFGQRRIPQYHRKQKTLDPDTLIRSLSELSLGDAVVHIDHGIGRYQGLQALATHGRTDEYLLLEYAGGDKIYVPVTQLYKINRYTGVDQASTPLHRLGNEHWTKTKQKAAKKALDIAAELLDVYAQREAQEGHAYTVPSDAYNAFCDAFPFEETPDQTKAIQAVCRDLKRVRPMDRLICGDVGFGKTEVAMRAAFIAVHNQRQVAILVPTTLLAEQHYRSFCDRFSSEPVQVGILSRLHSETKSTLKKLHDGTIDIIIATHKLLSQEVKFKHLGLLIVDEEHRFGVKQKERIRALRAQVDLLTMTATPIPRTLNMAMAEIRDMSIIATPPEKRLPVKTFIREKNNAVVREAILREILRGGQVFYVHNEVKTMQAKRSALSELVPEATFEIAHGQMPEKQLEQRMSDFYHQRFHVLICSTIIETGIDIPSANTMIIERADHFGLAQLHQLRGRVGRSHHQAYAYLFTPHEKAMTPEARKRIDAISHADTLGAGFILATHDLEIRGAGEILGDEQSGHIQSIGYQLYMELLERAVTSLRQGNTAPPLDLTPPTEVNLRLSALIPDDYLHDVHTRLMLYKRIANARNEAALDDLRTEMIDRFGLLPDATKNLFSTTQLKLDATHCGISKIEAHPEGGYIEFNQDTRIEPIRIIQLIQAPGSVYAFNGTRLQFKTPLPEDAQRIAFITELLKKLTQ